MSSCKTASLDGANYLGGRSTFFGSSLSRGYGISDPRDMEGSSTVTSTTSETGRLARG
jgi:hypothetical protein